MGHRDQQAIRLLERQNKASGINIKPCQFSTVYECCIQSKMTRKPDIALGTSILSRHVNNPKESDWVEVKRIYRYLKHTMDKKLKLGNRNETENQLVGY